MRAQGPPDWLKETSEKRVDDLTASFRENLRQIAEAMAQEAQSEVIVVKHVDEAHTTLAKLGLSRRRWYETSEAFTAFGGALIGLAFATPDVCGVFLPDGAMRSGVNIATVLVLALIGAGFFCYGWMMPISPRPSGERRAWPLAVVAAVALLVAFGLGVWLGPQCPPADGNASEAPSPIMAP